MSILLAFMLTYMISISGIASHVISVIAGYEHGGVLGAIAALFGTLVLFFLLVSFFGLFLASFILFMVTSIITAYGLGIHIVACVIYMLVVFIASLVM